MRSTICFASSAALFLACGGPPPGHELFLRPQALRRADAIVVLGNRPVRGLDGRIAPEPARRVRRGVELYERRLAPRLLLSGGPSPNGGTEAEVMAAYARELGVPEEALLIEDRSRDTADNARLSVALLCRGQPDCHPRVVVVSSPYHLRRATRLFECAGAEVQHAEAALPPERADQVGLAAYEYGTRLAAIFVDLCGRARPSP